MTTENYPVNPQFEKILSEMNVDEIILHKLARHSEEAQQKIFSAFKDLFEAELMFVLMHFEATQESILKNKSNI